MLRIQLPPLRDRKDDLAALVMDVLTRLGARDLPIARELVSPAFTEVLARYAWPGNVRQLRNYVERQVALGDSLVPPGMDSGPPGPPSQRGIPVIPVDQPLKIAREEWNRQFEVRYLESMLELHGNNVTAAARAAGVDRVHFYRLLWKHGLRGQEGDVMDPTTSTRRIPNLD